MKHDSYYESWTILVTVPVRMEVKKGSSKQWKRQLERKAAQGLSADVGGVDFDNGCYGYKSKSNRKIEPYIKPEKGERKQ